MENSSTDLQKFVISIAEILPKWVQSKDFDYSVLIIFAILKHFSTLFNEQESIII